MRRFGLILGATIIFSLPGLAAPLACATSPLTAYLNGGDPFSCRESPNVTIGFNRNLLPSYVGLSLLSSNNSAAMPSSITTVPGSPSLDFQSNAFNESSALLSSQAELVQFNVSATTPIVDTTFHLDSPQVSAGGLGLGTGVAIGQELVCVGGNFTSLPVGLVTSVANGVLGTGEFGCNGTVLVGTAATEVGLLSAVTDVLALPNLTGVSSQADIQLTPYQPEFLDVIKLQALVTTTGGSAQTGGFGDSFSVAPAPEPNTIWLLAGVLIAVFAGKSGGKGEQRA
ncbi:MAG: hypothetical protein KGN84_05835 [Acidobacteriota bacterium]|nr:hypothetical protein [Acidobacteriota bacterium]